METRIPLANGGVTLIDAGDAARTLAYTWRKSPLGYAIGRVEGRTVLLHRFLLGDAAAGLDIHHVNGDSLDNRRANLEALTRSEHAKRDKPRVRQPDVVQVEVSRETYALAKRLAAKQGLPVKTVIAIALGNAYEDARKDILALLSETP